MNQLRFFSVDFILLYQVESDQKKKKKHKTEVKLVSQKGDYWFT